MSEPQNRDESSAQPDEAVPPQSRDANPSAPSGDQPISGELTKEEQWALFEKELKESDWGHQPC